MIDIFWECANHNHEEQLLYSKYAALSLKAYCAGRITLHDSRIVFSCLMYCLVALISTFCSASYKNGLRPTCNHIYGKLLHKKSYLGIIVNVFLMWICALNLLLISMTIPNIKNPGPLNSGVTNTPADPAVQGGATLGGRNFELF